MTENNNKSMPARDPETNQVLLEQESILEKAVNESSNNNHQGSGSESPEAEVIPVPTEGDILVSQEINDESSKSSEDMVLADIEQEIDSDQDDYASTPAPKEIIAGVGQDQFNRLTKKNQQFVVSLERQLHGELHYEVQGAVFGEIIQTLLDGQGNSQTAKQIYGTPTELAQVVRDQNLKGPEMENEEKSSDFLIGLDGALFLGSLFTFVTGLSMYTAKNGVEGQVYMGALTMILNYVVAGFAMLVTAKNLPDPDAAKGKKGYTRYFLISIAAMVMWFVVVSLSAVVFPRIINPVLPAMVYMLIGAATFALRFYFRKKYNIKGGVF